MEKNVVARYLFDSGRLWAKKHACGTGGPSTNERLEIDYCGMHVCVSKKRQQTGQHVLLVTT
jgi:hypothetical protein